MRISDWSSDVCSSDLIAGGVEQVQMFGREGRGDRVAFLEAAVIAQLARDGFLAFAAAEMQRRQPAELLDKADGEGEGVRRVADREILGPDADRQRRPGRSEEWRVGKERVSTCSARR